MRAILIVLLGSFVAVTAPGFLRAWSSEQGGVSQSSGSVSARGANDRFAGTWKLVSTERRDGKGQLLPSATPGSQDRLGFIAYDPAGYMAVTIMQGGRQKYAGQNPTPQEAQAALTSYTSYWGTFTVNEAEAFVTHHTQGALSPTTSGTDQKRGFTFSGNRLTLKPPVGASGVQSSLTWERVPDLPKLTPTHRRLIGFWKLVSNERRNARGGLVSSNPGQTGFIVYTASGHMMAHLMQPGRKKYAAAQPTPEETMTTLRTYTSYFGPYTIHDAERYVVHHRIGIINPGQVGSDAQRFYEFSGRQLILRPPPTKVEGQEVQGVITWERLSAEPGR